MERKVMGSKLLFSRCRFLCAKYCNSFKPSVVERRRFPTSWAPPLYLSPRLSLYLIILTLVSVSEGHSCSRIRPRDELECHERYFEERINDSHER